MTSIDEVGLARAAQKGDLNAFNQLVLLHEVMAFNVAYRIMSDQDRAADAVQNAFISAFRNISQYHGGSFRAWVMRIVTNSCYDELRRQKRRPSVPLEPYDEESNSEIESPAWLKDPQSSPEEQAENLELEKAIQHCLDGLPEDFRAIVLLVEVEGMDYREAATVIQKPEGTVKSRLARARLRLRDCLRGFKELIPEQLRLMGEETT
jgi:RNA polymerase sigma-70 factor, ECF subfamily